MQVESKHGQVFDLPSTQEEAEIRAGIAEGPATCELPDETLETLRAVGRPKAAVTKQPVSIRLSPEVVEYFKSTGKVWQTQMDAVLLAYVDSHR